jgi:hypothetical protein
MMMMMVMVMNFDALASKDPSSDDDGSLLASSPLWIPPEDHVLWFSGCSLSLLMFVFTLHMVIIFDEAVLMTGGTVRRYGWAWPYH